VVHQEVPDAPTEGVILKVGNPALGYRPADVPVDLNARHRYTYTKCLTLEDPVDPASTVERQLAPVEARGGFLVNPTADSIFDLSPSEKLQLVEDLWDDLAATPDEVPVHDWQKEELARRKANLMKHPESALAWDEVKRRVRSRYGR
jgi:putative addiction module component (TIGR02574 family)